MLLLTFGLNYLAMAALSVAMSRHHKVLLSGAPSVARTRVLRVVAVLLMGVALTLNIRELDVELGLIIGLLQLMLAGFSVGLLLALRSKWVLPLSALLPLGGLLSVWL